MLLSVITPATATVEMALFFSLIVITSAKQRIRLCVHGVKALQSRVHSILTSNCPRRENQQLHKCLVHGIVWLTSLNQMKAS